MAVVAGASNAVWRAMRRAGLTKERDALRERMERALAVVERSYNEADVKDHDDGAAIVGARVQAGNCVPRFQIDLADEHAVAGRLAFGQRPHKSARRAV